MPSSNDPTSEPILSRDELSHLILEPDMLPHLARTFAPNPTSVVTLRHYQFLSQSIDQLELDLERHRQEQQEMFSYLMETNIFRTKIQPILKRYRRKTRVRPYVNYSPSHNTPSASAVNASVDSSSHVEVITKETEPLVLSPHTHDETTGRDLMNGMWMPGEKWNPIVIHDDEDVCARCKQQGHQQEDCATPIRSFEHCNICAWTKQAQCNHFDVSPAWLKELKANIDKKNN